jgi:hypothetical protein
MSKQYDTAIVHSYFLNPDCSPTSQIKERVDLAVKLFLRGETATLTMPGGYATKGVPCTHSEAMRRYAIEKGMDDSRIYSENLSLDTVGEAIFTKLGVVFPNKLESIIAVSHDYHIPRLKEIYQFVYGNQFDLRFEKVDSGLAKDPVTLSKEEKSLKAFSETFRGISSAKDDAILRRLFEAHPLYIGRVDLQKELLEILITNKGDKKVLATLNDMIRE